MYPSFFRAYEVTRLETFILTVLSIAAPVLIVFALYTFAAITIINSYKDVNHSRLVAAFYGHRRAAQVRYPDAQVQLC